jgi:predicted amidohydrolase YtcJ
MQPVFVGEYSRWAENRVGKSRVHWVLRTRDFLRAGVPLAFGTDYPSSDAGSPIATLHCAVTRQGADGKPEAGWYPEQRVDVDQALRMMTAGPAYAAFQEKDLGSLTVGRYADFTALSANHQKLNWAAQNPLRSAIQIESSMALALHRGRITGHSSPIPVRARPI